MLGRAYTLVLPMTVIRVDDGYVVENTATQITNDRKDVTHTVTNPLAPINPAKDVIVTVGSDSVDGDPTIVFTITNTSSVDPDTGVGA